jgi:hypothetical protein
MACCRHRDRLGAAVSAPLTFARFLAFSLGWSALAGAMLKTPVHPLAIFAVWAVGFLWGTGYIIDGQKGGDALALYTVGYWVALAVVGLVFVVAVS